MRGISVIYRLYRVGILEWFEKTLQLARRMSWWLISSKFWFSVNFSSSSNTAEPFLSKCCLEIEVFSCLQKCMQFSRQTRNKILRRASINSLRNDPWIGIFVQRSLRIEPKISDLLLHSLFAPLICKCIVVGGGRLGCWILKRGRTVSYFSWQCCDAVHLERGTDVVANQQTLLRSATNKIDALLIQNDSCYAAFRWNLQASNLGGKRFKTSCRKDSCH